MLMKLDLFRQIFEKSSYQISWKPVHWEPNCSMGAVRQKDTPKLMFCWPCIIVCQIWWNQRYAFFIQFIENQGSLRVSSITCSSSGGTAQAVLSILRAYNVSWLWHDCNFHCNRDTVMLETFRGPWFSINWKISALRWFVHSETRLS
jgi:hypothetical protein